MKSDSTKKSSTKNSDESKTSEKKKHEEKNRNESLEENLIPSEKKIENDLKIIEIEEYPNYLESLLRQSDWFKHNDRFNLLKNNFENKFKSILEKKKIEFVDNGGNEIDFYYTPGYKKEFYNLFKNYRNKKNEYFKELSSNMPSN